MNNEKLLLKDILEEETKAAIDRAIETFRNQQTVAEAERLANGR